MLRILAAIFVLFLSSLDAAAVAGKSCITLPELRAIIVQQMPTAKVAEVIDAEAAAFLAAFNRLPPQSDVETDAMLIITTDGAPITLALFFRQRCLIGRSVLGQRAMEQLLRELTDPGV